MATWRCTAQKEEFRALGFRVLGLGFRASGFRVQGFGCRVHGFGFWVQGFGFWGCLGFRLLGFGV